MKKILALAALLVAFSPLSQAQNYPQHHADIRVDLNQPWQPGPNMRNDREVVVVDEHHNIQHRKHKAKPHVRCRDGSRQYTARECRHHRGVR